MPGPFEEGPVKISFKPSKEKQRVTIVIDFGKTKANSTAAALMLLEIIKLLRSRLGVSLSMFR